MTSAPWPADLLAPPWRDRACPQPGLLGPLLPPREARPARGRDVVVLLDGLGSDLLASHLALAPALRALRDRTEPMRTVFPATTAAAMASLLTGASPLEHGMLGYTVADDADGGVIQQLTGQAEPGPAPDPEQWLRAPTLAERSDRRTVHVGPARHDGSFLTRSAFAGWEFTGHRRASERVDAVRLASRRAGDHGLVWVHVPDIDHAGHVHGTDSDAWREALADADAFIGALQRRLPRGTRLTITADHGMVDTDDDHRVDLGEHPDVARRMTRVAGEPRALAIQTEHDPMALAADLRELLGEWALVLSQQEVLAAGLYGAVPAEPSDAGVPVDPVVARRLPHVLVLARGRWAIDDFSRRSPGARAMIGQHGSLTRPEARVPVIRTVCGD